MLSEFQSPYTDAEAADGVLVVHFTGASAALDEETIQRLHDRLTALADESSQNQLVLDFGNVEYVSSRALGAFVNLQKKLLAAGRRLALHNLSPEVHEVFMVPRLDKFLNVRIAEPRNEAAPDGHTTAAPSGVLVVDDDATLRSALEQCLRREGFEVWAAAHGHQAIELCRRHPQEIAVVLLDVLMPGMDGPRTLLALQQLCPAVRCCFMTGDPRPYTEEALLQMGAFRMLRKPFALTEVVDALSQLARGSSRRRQDRWI
jgi:anti-anti-sigma factor